MTAARHAVLSALLIVSLAALARAQATRPAADQTAPKKPSLAVLPFLAANGTAAEKALAEKMRFAVSQKLSTDTEARTAGGAYDRLDNVQVDQLISALQISFGGQTAPDDDDMQKLLAALDTQWTIAGSLNGRQLNLTLYEKTAITKTASVEIPPDRESPKLAVEKVLTELTGTAFAHIRDVEADHSDPKAEARFAARANLVQDPGFELAAKDPRKVAANWEAILGPDHYPPPLITADQVSGLGEDRVAVIPRSAAPAAPKTAVSGNACCLLMRMSKNTAENNGLACESTWIPIEQGKKYRFTVQYHSDGPTARLFLKGFAEKPDQFSNKNDPETSRREFYRAQILPRKANTGWEPIEMDFTPGSLKPTDPKIQWLRVDLYIYLKPGDVYFDDVVVKKLDE